MIQVYKATLWGLHWALGAEYPTPQEKVNLSIMVGKNQPPKG